MDNFAEFYQDGGVWMHFIALTAIIGAGVTIERFIFLFFRFNINGGQFFNQIQKLVMANNIDRAIKLCNAADKAALARVIKAGLTRANKSEADIAAAIEEATLEVGPRLNKRTAYLSMLANVSTLLGLLGTIFGLIQAFKAVAVAGVRHGLSPSRPPFWGGFRITPVEIEFWADGAFRLHDRFRWVRQSAGENWQIHRLNP